MVPISNLPDESIRIRSVVEVVPLFVENTKAAGISSLPTPLSTVAFMSAPNCIVVPSAPTKDIFPKSSPA